MFTEISSSLTSSSGFRVSEREPSITAEEGEIVTLVGLMFSSGGRVDVGDINSVDEGAKFSFKKLEVLSITCAYRPSIIVPITFDW